jgi:hypothetical protein
MFMIYNMEEKIKVINYQGQKIVFVDMSGMKEEEILLLQKKMAEVGIRENARLFILDVHDTHTTEKVKNGSKEVIAAIEAKVGKVRNALLGLSGLQKMIANLISRDLYFASNTDDASKWLVEQLKKLG